jgi:hypothetical protein
LATEEATMAKKTSRGKTRKKPSETKDLPIDRKAKSVKGGAFSIDWGDGSVRNTVGGSPITKRNTI